MANGGGGGYYENFKVIRFYYIANDSQMESYAVKFYYEISLCTIARQYTLSVELTYSCTLSHITDECN